MPSEIPTSDVQADIKAETPLEDINAEDELLVTKMLSTEPSTEKQWQQFGERTSVFIDSLPSYVADFFNKYKPILVTLGWILVAFTSVKVTLAVLDAINDTPFLGLILELIGLAYVIWFIYRYLLSATNRQELSKVIKTVTEQFFGLEN